MLKRARRLTLRCLNGRSRRAQQTLCLLLVGLSLIAGKSAQAQTSLIIGAEFIEPTDRYDHGVLGPDAEWGALRLTIAACQTCDGRDIVLRLPPTRVFEDLAPRLIDLDFDGAPEVVVIESDASLGARLSIYGATGLITATPYIGNSFRWLAPLGAADLDDDGAMELAYIDRPHLAKILRVWRYQNRTLTEIASAGGLTNHKIGEAFISGGIRDCGEGPEIITADAGWSRIMATQLSDDQLGSREIAAFTGPASLAGALNCP